MVALLQKEAPDSAFPKGSLALFARAGGLWAYFLTAKPKTQLFPQEGWGLSSTHRGFESPQELYQEARLSLMTGIRYCTHPTICHVQVYLARHLTEPLSIQKLAAIFYLSPLYLSSLYKKQTGEALMHSLNKARLYYAARQLSCTNLSLAEVAQSSGFQDYSYFGRIFKKYMGESPEHYRRSHQQ